MKQLTWAIRATGILEAASRRGTWVVRQAALGAAVICATLLLTACATRNVELMPGDRFDLTEQWAVTIPEEGLHITGTLDRVEQAVREGLSFDELATLAAEQSGLQDR